MKPASELCFCGAQQDGSALMVQWCFPLSSLREEEVRVKIQGNRTCCKNSVSADI